MKRPDTGLTLEFPLFERLDQTAAEAPEPADFFGLLVSFKARAKNLPQCLVPGVEVVDEPPTLDVDLVSENGVLDLAGLVGRFITLGNFAKSTRCAGCIHDQACKGLQLNLARHFGLKVLKPMEGKDG